MKFVILYFIQDSLANGDNTNKFILFFYTVLKQFLNNIK